IRDVELEVRMSSRVTMRVPVHIRYDLGTHGGELRIERLAAYWELPGMIVQFLRSGFPAAPVSTRLTMALLKNQGPVGALGFAQGFRRVGNAAKATSENFLDALSRGDVAGARRYLDPQAVVDVDELAARLRGMRTRKYLAAGGTVA
ncbi:hypothetical protein, partial [Prevotella lacticifex]|uniref:hypothetical protein n=1 Tax=Prevotella lacticifex TaxID=2854755 RepID=UPI001CC5769F